MPKFQKYQHPILRFDRYKSKVHVHDVEVVHERGDFIVHENYMNTPGRDVWVVAHKPTGLTAWELRRKTDAVELCNRLGKLPTIDDADDLRFVGTEDRVFVSEFGWKYKSLRAYVLSGGEYENLTKRYEGNRMDKETLKQAEDITIKFRDEIYELERQKREARKAKKQG